MEDKEGQPVLWPSRPKQLVGGGMADPMPQSTPLSYQPDAALLPAAGVWG